MKLLTLASLEFAKILNFPRFAIDSCGSIGSTVYYYAPASWSVIDVGKTYTEYGTVVRSVRPLQSHAHGSQPNYASVKINKTNF